MKKFRIQFIKRSYALMTIDAEDTETAISMAEDIEFSDKLDDAIMGEESWEIDSIEEV
jgi:hypothetical protein